MGSSGLGIYIFGINVPQDLCMCNSLLVTFACYGDYGGSLRRELILFRFCEIISHFIEIISRFREIVSRFREIVSFG